MWVSRNLYRHTLKVRWEFRSHNTQTLEVSGQEIFWPNNVAVNDVLNEFKSMRDW